MNTRLFRLLLCLIPLACVAVHAPAQVLSAPSLLNFQGRLARPDGTPVPDGNYAIRFSLHTALTGGTEKWNQTLNPVTVRNGAFAVLLNTSTGAADKFSGDLYLEIKIGADAPLTPRQQLVSVAYAMKANSVPDGSIGAAQIANGAITADKFAANLFNPLTWLLGGNSGTNPASSFLGTTDNQPLVFRTNNTEKMRLLANGNLGIGTDSPAQKLTVAGGNIQIDSGRMLGASPADAFAYDGDTVGHYALGWYNDSWNGFGSTAWLTGYSGIKFFTSGTPRMAITQGGNIGIGTATPAAALHVAPTSGIILGVNPSAGGFTALQLSLSAASDGYAQLQAVKAAGSTYGDLILNPNAGNVGIGTNAPASRLHVNGTAQMTGFKLTTGAAAGRTLLSDAAGVGTWGLLSTLGIADNAITTAKITDANVTTAKIANNAITTAKIADGAVTPAKISGGLNYWGLSGNAGTNPSTNFLGTTDGQPLVFKTGNAERMRMLANGRIGIGTDAPQTTLDVKGTTRTQLIEVVGGSDVAEPYHIASAGAISPLPGMVVAIDPNKIGQMRVAATAYDKTVAGIISGANGIQPGITLRQQGTVADGTLPVASIGRVWCWCDADQSGAIEAGDMLTTSDTPGHAMRVTDHNRANGAVIGKAMSSLKSGRGLVLVLVSLK